MKLISDIKQYLILNDFPSVNEAIAHNSKMFLDLQEACDRKLTTLRDELATDLYELEDEYYSSSYKQIYRAILTKVLALSNNITNNPFPTY